MGVSAHEKPEDAEKQIHQYTVRLPRPLWKMVQEAMDEEGVRKVATFTLSALTHHSRAILERKRMRRLQIGADQSDSGRIEK